MTRGNVKHHMDGLMALLLFGVFAVCVLAVLLTGAGAYRRLTRRDQAAFDRRTCVQYIATRVRQSDVDGAMTVEDFDGVDCLTFAEDIEGEIYLTRVYYYKGYLRELFSAAGDRLSPDAGEPVMAAGGLALSMEDGLLTVTVETVDGESSQLTLSLRSGEEGAA